MITIIKNCKINLIVNTVFKSTRNFNDKLTLQIKSKNTMELHSTDIKKHHELIESLKDINFKPEGIESITYKFTEKIYK